MSQITTWKTYVFVHLQFSRSKHQKLFSKLNVAMTCFSPVYKHFDIINKVVDFIPLSCVATSVLRMRLLDAVAFSKKLHWLALTKVITLKTQPHSVNAR